MKQQDTLHLNWPTINRLAHSRGYTSNAKLAQAIGVTEATVWRIKNGRSNPSAQFYAKLCKALHQPQNTLLKP